MTQQREKNASELDVQEIREASESVTLSDAAAKCLDDAVCLGSSRMAVNQYPPKDSERMAESMARISAVELESPADDAGFYPGCALVSVDGQPIRDIIDWRWLSGEECITVGYIDGEGDEGEVELWREPGQDWGFEFDGLVFDGVRQCRNACTFCFMYQLPRGMRPSLYLRDDDFRLSFLVGTFVTLTNMTPEDEQRIIEQRISPLRVSLQVSNANMRRKLLGKHAAHGLASLDRLLDAGIQFHAQIVLVPGENDGDILRESLEWSYARPGILNVGIVPLGYTRHQQRFTRSFNAAEDSQALLDLIQPFQQRAREERGQAWVFAADEFYRNAYRDNLLANIPPTEHYGDFELFEDGIGIIRSTIDDWQRAHNNGGIDRLVKAARNRGVQVRMIAGYAQREFLDALVTQENIADCFAPLYVKNDFFGGNVDVTGLLVGADIVSAIENCALQTDSTMKLGNMTQQLDSTTGLPEDSLQNGHSNSKRENSTQQPNDPQSTVNVQLSQPCRLFVVPRVIFNDDGLTLDDMTLDDLCAASGVHIRMVSCSPLQYFDELTGILNAAE